MASSCCAGPYTGAPLFFFVLSVTAAYYEYYSYKSRSGGSRDSDKDTADACTPWHPSSGRSEAVQTPTNMAKGETPGAAMIFMYCNNKKAGDTETRRAALLKDPAPRANSRVPPLVLRLES
ncbi:hypothetical protein M440DRAFT_1388449 [Trichoderma longibrachiatum ATCC 18648]|uniref:Uncharacterized protein n=1 Tax=Trichoderma longibrachiatum ATCC 18648 TaxID=983965 RepID=A0A2T4CEV0_TRILO|nr:hypothetical protein M440DRAFT_1388449 [Trichoderma longibrachiatum ATCC 18648]